MEEAGGSGYVEGVAKFTYRGVTYTPSTSNGARSGHGQAKISFVAFATVDTAPELPPEPFTSETFEYKGLVEKFIVPTNGVYLLETWGASGGGAGGYAKGYKYLEKDTELFICIGGTGTSGSAYNGGGTGGSGIHLWGGGATHIALQSGTLRSIGASNISKVLIVAGGGGGNGEDYAGGSGGGTNGGAAAGGDAARGLGGTQTSGGKLANGSSEATGGFGYGGNAANDDGAGGGGLYGGSGGRRKLV